MVASMNRVQAPVTGPSIFGWKALCLACTLRTSGGGVGQFLVKGCIVDATTSGYGIYLQGGTASGNVVSNSGIGISLGAGGNVIGNSVVTPSGIKGIYHCYQRSRPGGPEHRERRRDPFHPRGRYRQDDEQRRILIFLGLTGRSRVAVDWGAPASAPILDAKNRGDPLGRPFFSGARVKPTFLP